MSHCIPAGYITLPALKVIDAVKAADAEISADRAIARQEFIDQFKNKEYNWFGKLFFGWRKLDTDEKVVKMLKDDMWLSHELYYLSPKFCNSTQGKLRALATAAQAVIDNLVGKNGTDDMLISVDTVPLFSDHLSSKK